MRKETIDRIVRDTADLPERWREVLQIALLDGDFKSEAHRLIQSAETIHSHNSSEMDTAESILAGDAFIPMAVEILLDNGVPLEEIDSFLAEAAGKFDK